MGNHQSKEFLEDEWESIEKDDFRDYATSNESEGKIDEPAATGQTKEKPMSSNAQLNGTDDGSVSKNTTDVAKKCCSIRYKVKMDEQKKQGYRSLWSPEDRTHPQGILNQCEAVTDRGQIALSRSMEEYDLRKRARALHIELAGRYLLSPELDGVARRVLNEPGVPRHTLQKVVCWLERVKMMSSQSRGNLKEERDETKHGTPSQA